MKYLVISDIHGSSKYLKMVLTTVNDYDNLVILGDILYHGPRNDLPVEYNPREVIEILNNLKKKVIAVRGNCDAKIDLDLLEFDISNHKWIDINGNRVFLTHGDEYNVENLVEAELNYVILHGHTHINKVSCLENIKEINIGSLSIPKDGHHTYAIINANMIEVYDLITKETIFEESI